MPLVQTKSGTSGVFPVSFSYALTFDSTVTAGNLLIATVIWEGASVPNVSDSNGNTFTLATSPMPAGSAIFYCENCLGGASDVVTVGITSGPNFVVVGMSITEWSGQTASCLDQATSKNNSSTSTPDSGTITTTHAVDLLVAAVWLGGPVGGTITESFTSLYNVPDMDGDIGGAAGYSVVTSTGNQTETWTLSTSRSSPVGCIASFKLSAAPPTGGIIGDIYYSTAMLYGDFQQ